MGLRYLWGPQAQPNLPRHEFQLEGSPKVGELLDSVFCFLVKMGIWFIYNPINLETKGPMALHGPWQLQHPPLWILNVNQSIFIPSISLLELCLNLLILIHFTIGDFHFMVYYNPKVTPMSTSLNFKMINLQL